MRSFLLFRLYGPLASWGEIAVGEVRPTALQPTRSALLGLFSAALGLRRGDDEALATLGSTLRFAVLVARAGIPARDYHTVQVPPSQRGRIRSTRADQLRERRHEFGTILSYRDYRCDALYDVAAWHEGESSTCSLEAIAAALERPVFPPYLGRKSCPLALPLTPRVVEASDALSALEEHPAPVLQAPGLSRPLPFSDLLPGRPLGLFWEGDPGFGEAAAERIVVRRDDPVSSARRTFRTRMEGFRSVDRLTPAEEPDAPESDAPLA